MNFNHLNSNETLETRYSSILTMALSSLWEIYYSDAKPSTSCEVHWSFFLTSSAGHSHRYRVNLGDTVRVDVSDSYILINCHTPHNTIMTSSLHGALGEFLYRQPVNYEEKLEGGALLTCFWVREETSRTNAVPKSRRLYD